MRSGDACPNPKCKGRLHVRNSERQGNSQVQYLACAKCGDRPSNNKVVIPGDVVRRRAFA